MRRSRLLAFAALAGLLAPGSSACNTYDPDLGPIPFRCGPEEPRCPAGYACVDYSAEEQLCESLDGDVFTCADDGEVEPNDLTTEATNTLIPAQGNTYRLVGLSICPDGDEDYFLFAVGATGGDLRADLEHEAADGQLMLEVLNAGGAPIRAAEAVSEDDPNLLRAQLTNLPQGTYYVRVRAPEGIRNNYAIEIVLSDT